MFQASSITQTCRAEGGGDLEFGVCSCWSVRYGVKVYFEMPEEFRDMSIMQSSSPKKKANFYGS